MTMTRKHFVGIASAVKETRDRLDRPAAKERMTQKEQEAFALGIDSVAMLIARELRRHNPQFDTERFLDACGFKGGDV